MTELVPFCIPAFLGYFTLSALLNKTPLRWKELFLLAASIPTGLGICSVILFFSLWFVPSQARAISLTAGLGTTLFLGGFLLWRRSKDAPKALDAGSPFNMELFRQKFSSWIPKDKKAVLKSAVLAISFLFFLITLESVIRFFLVSVSTNITGGWDARYMWSLKAKFMFRSPEAWRGMFSPLLSWSHQDYPLLWPGSLAWGWNCLGHESLLWAPWVSLCFYVSCALILVWYLGTQVSPVAGWWGGSFFLGLIPPLFWSIHQYTDLPLAFFMTASVLMLLTGLRSGHANLLVISGLMAGLAAWTKNEGLQFLGVTGLLIAGLKILGKGKTFSDYPARLSPFLWGSCLPLLTVLVFKIFFGKTGEYLGSAHSLGMIFWGRSESFLISRAFTLHFQDFSSWKGLWIFFFAAVFTLCFKRNGNKYAWLLPAWIVLLNAGYSLAFLISPAALAWHLETALQRLLIHTAPLALVFCFEILTFRQNAHVK